MRVYQFITLFLALGVVCGCSHRRAHQQPIAASLCDCSTCLSEQQELISSGAVPADHFDSSHAADDTIAPATNKPSWAKTDETKSNDLSPEYASVPGDEVITDSPFSSGNPINMDEAPQLFNTPAVDEIELPPNQIPNNRLEIKPEFGSLNQLDPSPNQASPNNAFKPFNRDIFKIKADSNAPLPPELQPPILINKVPETSQPDLSTFTPPSTSQLQLSIPEPNSTDFEFPLATAPEAMRQEQPEFVEPETDTFTPQVKSFEPVASVATPDFAANIRNFNPQPIQPKETVVEGQLYVDQAALYARSLRGQQVSSPVPGNVQPASIQRPVEHQGIAQNSQLDPIYGLPLNNQVQFNSLPAIAAPQFAPPAAEAQHLHVHIHHEYGANQTVAQGPVAYQNGQPASNVQVVYRDDKGRVIIAPPTPATGVIATMPNSDQRTYYIPPKQVLRLKAVSPIDHPRSSPSIARIQRRDMIVHGGTHLLNTPDHQAHAVQTNYGLPGIDHEKLREAFKNSPAGNSLR